MWTVRAHRRGRVHIVRWWSTVLDGVEIDHYESRELAEAYVKYQNERAARAGAVS